MKNEASQEDRFTIIPDALMEFQHTALSGTKRRLVLILEHDRGSEEQKYFRRRIRDYVVFLKHEAYKDLFQIRRITIVFTTFTGERRLSQMREWTQQELAATKEPPATGRHFLFSGLAKLLDHRQLFFDPAKIEFLSTKRT